MNSKAFPCSRCIPSGIVWGLVIVVVVRLVTVLVAVGDRPMAAVTRWSSACKAVPSAVVRDVCDYRVKAMACLGRLTDLIVHENCCLMFRVL